MLFYFPVTGSLLPALPFIAIWLYREKLGYVKGGTDELWLDEISSITGSRESSSFSHEARKKNKKGRKR